MTRNIEELQTVSMEGFQVVRGEMFRRLTRLTEPSITFWYNSISFSKASLTALNLCERVRIEVNPKTRCILLIPVTCSDKDAIRWAKLGNEPQPRKIDCVAFTSQLYETWNWDRNSVYRAVGRLVTADRKLMLLFDFSNPEHWLFKDKAKPYA